jgi:uracil-DNA glycosylase
MTTKFNLSTIDASWVTCIEEALTKMDTDYLTLLYTSHDWLPGADKIFNAFSLPINQVNYVLFGESPYPRAQSANGYAFWDAAVNDIWSDKGFSKPVNRATSLRNIMKMLLVTEGLLQPYHTTQNEIAKINKQGLVQTNQEFFNNFLQHGFLMLNATPVLQLAKVRQDARAWRPFLQHVLAFLLQKRPQAELILLGNIANEIDPLIPYPQTKKLYAEHPYNITFIHNPTILDFFKPLHLLKRQISLELGKIE